PPHILVTTPESLYILLTAAKSREILRTIETVIVDEIHAVADDKRGAHLALSLERLDHLTGKRLTRIGLSATQKPIVLVAHHLAERLGKEAVTAHHGSLSRKLRLVAEKKLKSGELRALVATASLELGIDIGTVDLVCQIGSPRSISAGLQRIGRAGHWRGAVPKGRIFSTTRDELLECAALVRAIRQGDLDRIAIPEAPLDILAQ